MGLTFGSCTFHAVLCHRFPPGRTNRSLADRRSGPASDSYPTRIWLFSGSLPPDGRRTGSTPRVRLRPHDAGNRSDGWRRCLSGGTLRARRGSGLHFGRNHFASGDCGLSHGCERYDMRNSLLDFGRTLSATTALDPLLDSLVSRLQQVMNVGRIAIFIEDKHAAAGYRVARAAGLSSEMVVPPDFREMIRIRSAETGVVRTDDLDLVPETNGFVRRMLHYYVPCVVRGRMVAVIGLGRSADGALLSSEDVEILLTVSGYVAVA